jgi:hypothetical protein
MADSGTSKTRVEEYGVRSVKGRWSEWSMDGNGLDCETEEQTSGLSMEDLAWLIEPHRAALFPAESAKAETQPAGHEWVNRAALVHYLRTERQRVHQAAEAAGHEEQRMCLLSQALALRGVIELVEDGKELPPAPERGESNG